MESDKVLQRLELENRKVVLSTVLDIISNGLMTITTHRGIYKVNKDLVYPIWNNILNEIREIDNKLEELTGINQNKIEKLYEV